jgi:transposase-like protein
LARKKKRVFGKRYETDFKQATVQTWQQEQGLADGRSKQKFCRDINLSSITLDSWVKKFGSASRSQLTTPAPAPVERHAIVAVDEPRAVAVIDGSVADLVEAIKKYQGTVSDLKAKLHQWVDTL